MSRERDMDEDINWGKLFLKVILAFVIVLFVIWLISRLFLNKSLEANTEEVFNHNLNEMYDVAEDYFSDDSKLPKDGKRTVLTLKEMYDKGLIDTLKVGNTTCSTKEKSSYAKVSNKEGKYTLTVLLTCGSNSDYVSKILKDISVKEEKEETTSNENTTATENNTSNNSNSGTTSSNSSNNSTSSSNNGSSTTTVETEKVVVTDYTTMEYKFCKIENESYYTVVYLNSSDIKVGYETTYTIQLDKLSNISKTKIDDDSYFLYRTYFNKYKKNLDKNFTIIDGNSAKDIAGISSNFVKASLKSGNFDYKLTEVYEKDGKYFVDVEITIKKVSNYTDTYNGTKINYVPIYFTISYADLDNCVTDTYLNSSKYAKYYVVK